MTERMGEAYKAAIINRWEISGTLVEDVVFKTASTGTKMLKSRLAHKRNDRAEMMYIGITIWAGSLTQEEIDALCAWKAGDEVVIEGELDFWAGRLSIIVKDIHEKRW